MEIRSPITSPTALVALCRWARVDRLGLDRSLFRRGDLWVGLAASLALYAGARLGLLPFSQTEVFGFVSGAACVWLLVKENVWNWPVGVLNAAVFLVLFLGARLYADSGLQVVYIVLGLGGWYYWLRGGSGRQQRQIARTGALEWALLLAATAAATYGLTLYLRQIADTAPFWDALTTALSLTATWMQARKLLENWWLWIAADVVYVPLYFVKQLPLTGVLYVVFLLMCLRGLYDWSRSLKRVGQSIGDSGQRFGLAVVAGKFYPFHTGHKLLIETALSRSERVVVLVCYRHSELIPGELRAAWVKATLPTAEVVLIDQDAEGLGEDEDSAAWGRWTIKRLGRAPDAVFSSEDYGDTWAQAMGAVHVAVDKARQAVPISGTAIRQDPLANLDYLVPVVRHYFVKRVCLLGAESTGKSTLARQLADHYKTVWVPEYGHAYSVFRDRLGQGAGADWTTPEFLLIGQTQNWLEDFLAGYANRVLFVDTDAFVTARFHEEYVGAVDPALEDLSAGRVHDLYLLTDPETPFQQDEFGLRQDGGHRRRMHEAYKRRLDELHLPYLEVQGAPAERLAQAVAAVDELLQAPALELRAQPAELASLLPALRLAEGL